MEFLHGPPTAAFIFSVMQAYWIQSLNISDLEILGDPAV